MIKARQRILWASLLASATFAASAQTPPPPNVPAAITQAASPAQPEAQARKPHDGKGFERMQERRAKHLAELKAKLKLNASQEGAWTSFAASMQPAVPTGPRPDRAAARAEFEKMTTPQRLDRMQARQTERAARFAQRADATRAFYATLDPQQQKTFDAEATRHASRGEHGRRGDHDGRHGDRPAPPAKG